MPSLHLNAERQGLGFREVCELERRLMIDLPMMPILVASSPLQVVSERNRVMAENLHSFKHSVMWVC